ncbi:MAG: hypothetical protein ACXWLR_14765 [Myxococcales bacterium]
MRGTTLLGMAVAMTVALAAPRARACGQGSNYGGALVALGVGAIVLGAADIGMSLYDLPSIFTATPRSAGYGTVEMLLGGAQLALGIAGMSSNNSSGFWTGYTIWMGALTVHGIWSIAASLRAPPDGLTPAPDPPPRDLHAHRRLSIGPTYAPVGQLAHPGFGVVGRF